MRALLDELGYAEMPILISECTRKHVQRGDVLAEFDRYCGRIKHAVAGVAWFVWSSRDPAFADVRLGLLMADDGNIERFQSILDRHAAAKPPVSQPPPPEWAR